MFSRTSLDDIGCVYDDDHEEFADFSVGAVSLIECN